MKRKLKFFMFLIVPLTLFGCAPEANEPLPPQESLSEWQQMASDDFEYLWQQLETNYPLWGALERDGVDKAELYSIYSKQAKNTNDLTELYGTVSAMLGGMKNLTHLYAEKEIYVGAYEDSVAIAQQEYAHSQFWFKFLTNPVLAETYGEQKKFSEVEFPAEYHFTTDEAILTRASVTRTDKKEGSQSPNVVFSINDDKSIAHIEIKSFMSATMAYDMAALKNLYKEIADVPVVIFDVSQNYGGGHDFWKYGIIAPNITEPISEHYTALFPSGEYIEPFLADILPDAYPAEQIKMPENAEARKILVSDIKNDYLTRAVDYTNTVEPDVPGEKMLKGKIYILSGDGSFSSADAFVAFARDSGFATIVGTRTKGAGGLTGPLPMMLPKTHLLLKFDPYVILNREGFYRQVYGTNPDIDISLDGPVTRVNFGSKCFNAIAEHSGIIKK